MSDQMKYDEDDAIRFIRATLPEDVSAAYSDDDILYVIDIIWDWYEKNGYLEINADITGEEEVNVDKLVDFVKSQIKKDKYAMIDTSHIDLIVKGEIQYEESIDDFV